MPTAMLTQPYDSLLRLALICAQQEQAPGRVRLPSLGRTLCCQLGESQHIFHCQYVVRHTNRILLKIPYHFGSQTAVVPPFGCIDADPISPEMGRT